MLNQNLLRIFAYTCASLILLLGLSVIIGWYTHNVFFIRLDTPFPPMQFNTALCFVLSGLALFFTIDKKRLAATTVSIILLILSGLTLLQYLFNTNLNIDELFIKSFLTIIEPYPGRAAPNTVFAFLLSSFIFLLLQTMPSKNKNLIILIGIFIIVNLGLIGLIAHLTTLTTYYGAGQWIKMAFHSAIGFIILSCGLITLVYLNKKKEEFFPIIPLTISFIILLFTFLIWQSIKKNQDDHLRRLVQTKIEYIAHTIQVYMKERGGSFARISHRWQNRLESMSKAEWQADVMHYIKDQPGYIAIEWVDSSYRIRWVAPQVGNEQLIGFNLLQESIRGNEISKALKERKMQLSPPINLMQGGKGVLLLSPLFRQEGFDGFMVGVMNTQLMLDSLMKKELIKNYEVKLYNKDNLLYHSSKENLKKEQKEMEERAKISLFGQEWIIALQPSNTLYYQVQSSWFSVVTLLTGIIIALISGFFVATLQLLKLGSLKLNETQQNLAEVNGRLNSIIEGSYVLIAALDLNMNFIAFNTLYKNEIYRLFKINLTLGMNFSVLLNLMDEENRKKALGLWSKALEGNSFTVVEHFKDKRFNHLNYEIHYSPIFDSQGRLIGANHIAYDITKRVINEQKMIESREKLEVLVTRLERQNKELGWLKDMISMLQSSLSLEATLSPISNYVNKILSETAGAIYLIDKNDSDFLNEILSWQNPVCHQKRIVKSDCWALLRSQIYHAGQSDGLFCAHINYCDKKPKAHLCMPLQIRGEILGLLYVEMKSEKVTTNRIIYLSQIVAEQIALSFYNINLREELKNQSTHDNLTGLYNRLFFEQYLYKEFHKSLRTAKGFAIFLMDVDHFKKINDQYGHLVGDRVLYSIAKQLDKNCRSSDLLCRWGGEEFILFLNESSREIVSHRAEILRHSIEKMQLDVEKHKISITISIGVAFYPVDGTEMDSLIAKADEALYEAKRLGRNRVILSATKDKDA